MYSIIATKKYIEPIRKAVQSVSEDILYENVGPFDYDGIIASFEEAARVTCSVLIIDIDIGPANWLVQGVKIYKQARPLTRVILFAPGRRPGDSAVAKLFNMAVYDIVAPDLPDLKDDDNGEQVENVIIPLMKKTLESKAANIADALRWDVSTRADSNEGMQRTKSEKEQIEKTVVEKTVVIEKEIIIGTTVIAVTSAKNGVGCTYTCIKIACYLARHSNNIKVAVIDLTKNTDIKSLDNERPKALNDRSFKFEGIDFYYNTTLTELLQLQHTPYNYIILDIGALKHGGEYTEHYNEVLRSRLTVLVTGSKPWHYEYLSNVLYKGFDRQVVQETQNFKILFTCTDENTYAAIKETLDSWDTYNMALSPELFKKDENADKVIESILRPVLPSTMKRKFKFPFVRKNN